MADLLNNTTFVALILGLWGGYMLRGFIGKSGSTERERYYKDKNAKSYLAQLSDEGLEAVEEALRNNRKIEAIKHFRTFTGLGLKESKDAVEYMIRFGPGD